MSRKIDSRYIYIIGILAIAILPLVVSNSYWIQMFTLMAIYSVLTYAMDLVAGYTGQVSIGHGGFYAIGAYATGIVMTKYDMPLLLALLVGFLISLVFGIIVGLPAIRVSGFYLAMETTAFALIIVTILERLENLTGGVQGLMGIPSPALGTLNVFGFNVSRSVFYYIAWVIAILIAWLVRNFAHSYLGRASIAIGGSPVAAETMGINSGLFKYLTFAFSAGVAGLGGGLYAVLIGFLSPENFGFNMSVFLLAMVLLGGMRSTIGPVIGGAVFAFLPQFLQVFRGAQNIVYGLILMFSFLIIPKGISALIFKREPFIRGRYVLTKQTHSNIFAKKRDDEDSILLELKGITKVFGGNTALDNLDMQIKRGEVRALIGPNGSGKTTTINIISGVYKPTKGSIILNGRDISDNDTVGRSRLGISRTFQNIKIFPEMTVLENVLVGAHNRYKSSWKAVLGLKASIDEEHEEIEKAMALLDFLGIGEYAEKIADELPYGIQKIVEVARAAISEPELLLLDEPAAGLNAEEMESLSKVITNLKNSGITILIIEHHMDFVLGLADKVTVLDFGKKIFEGLPDETRRDKKVREVYIGGESISA